MGDHKNGNPDRIHFASIATGEASLGQECMMAESTSAFPYETRLNILRGPLEVIDINAIEDARKYKWFNQTLCKVNDSVVRVAMVEGEYHWHKHDEDDEFFFVVDGLLIIDLEGRTVELAPGQGLVVPRGTVHRTRAKQRTVMLMVENAGIIPTGN
jgi:mannose-6-phosphate isomerase-like protein (cupin superfamily)